MFAFEAILLRTNVLYVASWGRKQRQAPADVRAIDNSWTSSQGLKFLFTINFSLAAVAPY